MPELPATPVFNVALERHLRRTVRRRVARRRAAGGALALAALALALSGLTSHGGASPAIADVRLPGGQRVVIGERLSAGQVARVRAAFARARTTLQVVGLPVPAGQADRVLAVRPPAGVPVDARGRFQLAAGQPGATRLFIGRAARPGEPVTTPAALAAALRQDQSRSERGKSMRSPLNSGRRAVVTAAATAALSVAAGGTVQAAEVPQGQAEIRTESLAGGQRTEQITTADGRFAQRRYGADGRLVSELIDDGRTVVQYSARTGRVTRHDSGGAVHDDRFEQWERTYRRQLQHGFTRVVGETTIDGRPAYELAAVAPPGIEMIGGGTGTLRVFVDAETYVPLRSVADGRVVMTATSSVVPIADVEAELHLSAAGARALRAR